MYQTRFKQLLRYLHTNIEEGITLDDLCREAGMSKYHFHRQFSAYLGMPVKTYMSKFSLLKAAQNLTYHPEVSVTDIAYQAGYQAPEAFARAFRSAFGVSPSGFRRDPDWKEISRQQTLLQNRGTDMNTNTAYTVSLIDKAPIKVAVMEHRGPQHLIGDTLRKFISWRKAHRLPPTKYRTFNLLFDDPQGVAPEDYRFGLATQIPENMSWDDSEVYAGEIPGGRYACLCHSGPDTHMEAKLRWLYEHWLPESGYQPTDFPMVLDRKTFYPDVPAHCAETDLLLPLQY